MPVVVYVRTPARVKVQLRVQAARRGLLLNPWITRILSQVGDLIEQLDNGDELTTAQVEQLIHQISQ